MTWTCRTANAPWAARWYHTTVIDAAGAIYVIGGGGQFGRFLQDVWASTDGGADRTRRCSCDNRCLNRVVLGVYSGVLAGH